MWQQLIKLSYCLWWFPGNWVSKLWKVFEQLKGNTGSVQGWMHFNFTKFHTPKGDSNKLPHSLKPFSRRFNVESKTSKITFIKKYLLKFTHEIKKYLNCFLSTRQFHEGVMHFTTFISSSNMFIWILCWSKNFVLQKNESPHGPSVSTFQIWLQKGSEKPKISRSTYFSR